MIGPEWVWHPLGACPASPHAAWVACRSYNLWSGIAGSFLTSVPGWGLAAGLFARHHNCREKRCWRLGHRHPEHGLPVCRRHYHADVIPQKPRGDQ